MSKILFLYEVNTPTVSLIKATFQDINLKYDIQSTFKKIFKINTADILANDVIVLLRSTDSLSIRIAEIAKKAGRFVVAFYDDDLLNRPNNRPLIQWRKTNVKSILKNSNLVWSTSKRIILKYKIFTIEKRGVQFDTIVRENEFRTHSKEKSETVRIVYAANPTHTIFFDNFIKPCFKKLGRINRQLSFTFIGVEPKFEDGFLPSNISINYVSGMPFDMYRQYMNTHDFDIGLAPINNDEFSKCKYFNKFLEYSIFQITGIYTHSEPYINVVKDYENGLLSYNTQEGWENALSYLIQNNKKCEELAISALKTVKNCFNEKVLLPKLLKDMPELLNYKVSYNNCGSLMVGKFEYGIKRAIEILYLMVMYSKTIGVNKLIQKIKMHIKS